jgi:hypothetical protein
LKTTTGSHVESGFSKASGGKVKPILNVAISESVRKHFYGYDKCNDFKIQGNITLDDANCPNAVDGDESAEWQSIFATPITARLNAAAPGANLTNDDTLILMDLCPFHVLVTGKPSPFCALFSEKEYESYEYFYDVDKFYGTG